eukprot:SAG11_NODE_33399_length_277_cov_1.168539_1_plen_81_part_01
MFPATFLRKQIVSCNDARLLAQKRLPWMVFDYIDGAAGEGRGEQHNRDELARIQLQPRILRTAEQRSLAVRVFGEEPQLPF